MKARLSAYLKKVRAGQTILILDRDEPVARLERISPQAADATGGNDKLVRLERAGLVRRATGAVAVKELRAPAPRAKESVVEALLEDRRTGR